MTKTKTKTMTGEIRYKISPYDYDYDYYKKTRYKISPYISEPNRKLSYLLLTYHKLSSALQKNAQCTM